MSQNWAESETGDILPTYNGVNQPVYGRLAQGESNRAAELQEMHGDLAAAPQAAETVSDETLDPTILIAKARAVLGVQDKAVKPSDPDSNDKMTRYYDLGRRVSHNK